MLMDKCRTVEFSAICLTAVSYGALCYCTSLIVDVQ